MNRNNPVQTPGRPKTGAENSTKAEEINAATTCKRSQ